MRGQPDKLGVVSVDRISGGFLQACVEPRVWIIEKGRRKRWRDGEKDRGRNQMGGGPGSAFPHFLFVIICQFNRSDYIPIMCGLDQSSVQPNSFTRPSFPQTPSAIPPSSLQLYHLWRVFFLIYNSKIYALNSQHSPTDCECSCKKKQPPSSFSIYKWDLNCNQQFHGCEFLWV